MTPLELQTPTPTPATFALGTLLALNSIFILPAPNLISLCFLKSDWLS